MILSANSDHDVDTCLGVPENEPVIMGVPPPADSHFTHGRRKFLGKNMNEDRAGVPRLLPDEGSSKRKGASSKSKEPPQKQSSKRKNMKVTAESSGEESFQFDTENDMYMSDNPIPAKTNSKTSRITTKALEVPFFSDSPRATRSSRRKKRLEPPTAREEKKEGKGKKTLKRGEIFVCPKISHFLNATTRCCGVSI